jgi:hypothetical protein
MGHIAFPPSTAFLWVQVVLDGFSEADLHFLLLFSCSLFAVGAPQKSGEYNGDLDDTGMVYGYTNLTDINGKLCGVER